MTDPGIFISPRLFQTSGSSRHIFVIKATPPDPPSNRYLWLKQRSNHVHGVVSLELLCSETFIIEGRRMLMIVFDRSKALTHVCACVCNRTCACDVFIRRAARPCCCSCFYCLTSVGVGCVCVGPVTLSS